MLDTKLKNYIFNTEDANANYELGLAYENIGQLASAVGFYLRSAERTDDQTMQYQLLLRLSICFQVLGERIHTERTLIYKAIALQPKRPEAYFLASKLYERKQEWQESYTYACLGLNLDLNDQEQLNITSEYVGKISLLFQKGLAAYYVGHIDQCREIMFDISNDENVPSEYRDIAKNNINQTVGYPANVKPYKVEMKNKIRYEFNNLNLIETNYSQSFQDIFVLAALDGKINGSYLEIGCGEPYRNSNTALLEEVFKWQGVGFDTRQSDIDKFKQHRSNLVYCLDAKNINYIPFLKDSGFKKDIDYLQLDCEPADETLAVLKCIPFDHYRFAVITFEHDSHVSGNSVKNQSREFLKSKGYELLVSDVAFHKTYSYEDWWVHPELVSERIRDKLRDIRPGPKDAVDYLFSGTTQHQQYLINQNQRKGFWVVDNFYTDPDAIRELALKQEYHQGGLGRGYIGRRTYEQFLFPGLKEEFERIMGEKITAWEEHGMNGRFQYSMEGEPLVYHCDAQKWAAMIYLTPNAPLETGTGSFALKGTKVFHNSQEGIMAAFRGDGAQNLDKTLFEPVDSIGNVYNRLVIFNAGYLHAALGYFGYKPENARLWQMFFFD